MSRHLFSALLLLAALVAYATGMATWGAPFVVAVAALEVWFYIRQSWEDE